MTAPKLLATAAAGVLVVAASLATAQAQSAGNGVPGPYYGPHDNGYANASQAQMPRGEESIVIQGRREYYNQPTSPLRPLGWPPAVARISVDVTSRGLDLATRRGAQEFRTRIRHAAWHVCRQLRAQYPYTPADSPNCYQQAISRSMVHADQAITDAEWRAGENPAAIQRANYRRERYLRARQEYRARWGQ